MSKDFFEHGLDAIGREPLAMAIARRLREAIVSGELSDQTPLPSEKELSQRLGVGRSSVREALRVLQAQGLVSGGDSVSTRGPVVTFEGALPTAQAALATVMQLGAVPLRDLLTLRILIEREALSTAARVRAPEPLERADEALGIMRQCAAEGVSFHEADVAFHAALIDAADNRALSLVMQVTRHAMAEHLKTALAEEPVLKKTLERLVSDHEGILAAVKAGQPRRAADLVKEHLEAFYAPKLARLEEAA